MRRAMIGGFAVLAVFAMMPSRAEAQRHYRSGNVTTPYGTFSQAEMMAGGGDPSVAQELKMQKLQMQQQQQYMAQMAKQQKAYQDYLKKHPEAAKAAQASQAAANRPAVTHAKPAKKSKAKTGSITTAPKSVAGAPTTAEAPTTKE